MGIKNYKNNSEQGQHDENKKNNLKQELSKTSELIRKNISLQQNPDWIDIINLCKEMCLNIYKKIENKELKFYKTMSKNNCNIFQIIGENDEQFQKLQELLIQKLKVKGMPNIFDTGHKFKKNIIPIFKISNGSNQVIKLYLSCDDNVDLFFDNEYEIFSAFKYELQ